MTRTGNSPPRSQATYGAPSEAPAEASARRRCVRGALAARLPGLLPLAVGPEHERGGRLYSHGQAVDGMARATYHLLVQRTAGGVLRAADIGAQVLDKPFVADPVGVGRVHLLQYPLQLLLLEVL